MGVGWSEVAAQGSRRAWEGIPEPKGKARLERESAQSLPELEEEVEGPTSKVPVLVSSPAMVEYEGSSSSTELTLFEERAMRLGLSSGLAPELVIGRNSARKAPTEMQQPAEELEIKKP